MSIHASKGLEFPVVIIPYCNWNYYKANEGYLQGQIGNPKGADQPNKKFYDPRVWLRKGEDTFVARLKKAFEDLNSFDANSKMGH